MLTIDSLLRYLVPVKSPSLDQVWIHSKFRDGANALKDFHSYPCASKIAPSLVFNDHRFTIDLRDFNLGKTGYGSR